MLDCGGSIPEMLNPFNYLRLLKRAKYLALRNTSFFSSGGCVGSCSLWITWDLF